MPFLNKAILIELLSKYGEDLNEKKASAPKTWYSIIADTANTALDALKKTAGKNTKEDSLRWYYKLKTLIIKACDEQNIDAWAELICKAGEAGYETRVNSLRGSKLSCCAFALRCYILNKVDVICSTIDKNKPLSEDQVLAYKIRSTIDKKIKEQLNFIIKANENINSNKSKSLEERAKSRQNNDAFHTYEYSSEQMIIIRQRLLCYLNAHEYLRSKTYQVFVPDKPQSLKEIIEELFPNFELFDFSSRMYSEETRKKIKIDLPLVFQPNYDAIFIRSKERDLQNDSDENAISNFEERVLKRNAPLAQTPILETLPERVFVPELVSLLDSKPTDEPHLDDKAAESTRVTDDKMITDAIIEHHYDVPATNEVKTTSPPQQVSRRSSHLEVLTNLVSQPPERKVDEPEEHKSAPLPEDDDREEFDSPRDRARFVRGRVGTHEIMPTNDREAKYRPH